MTFTDDDLKRLKGRCNSARALDSEVDTVLIVEIEALIARLEAAEKVINVLEDTDDLTDWSELNPAMEDWRKVAGRE